MNDKTHEQDQRSSNAAEEPRRPDAPLQVNGLPHTILSPFLRSLGNLYSEAGIRTFLKLPGRRWGVAGTHDWDDPADIEYSHRNEQFSSVLQVFHRQWLGVRAAAGSLPGMKLAIDYRKKLSKSDIKEIATAISSRRPKRIVIHGTSPNMVKLVNSLAGLGMAESIFIVYHGNIVQWCSDQERRFALSAIDLVKMGRAKKLHFMRAGNDFTGLASSNHLLLNMSPVVSQDYAGKARNANSVLVPGTSGWRKNIFCNALGAAMSPQVERVFHYAKDLTLPNPFGAKLERVTFVDRRTTLKLMSNCLATLYVSVVECHPMANLESEAVGTPCLRNPLFLDALEGHEYVRLVEVNDFANPSEISKKLLRAISVDRREMLDLIEDYLSKLNATAIQRYADFLDL